MTYFCLGENPPHHQEERRARSPSPPHNKVNSRRRLHSLSDVPVIQYHPLPPLYFAKTQNASLQLNQHPLFKVSKFCETSGGLSLAERKKYSVFFLLVRPKNDQVSDYLKIQSKKF